MDEKNKLNVGDSVVIKGKIVNVYGDIVVVETEGVDLPGSKLYTQKLRLRPEQVHSLNKE